MAQNTTRLSRRNFLLAVGAGGAATAAAALAVKPPVEAKRTVSGTGKRATRGYVASEHVNRYYETTKV